MHAEEKGAFALNHPRSKGDAGDGLVFRRGYTIVWSGWDPDAPRAGGLAMEVPSLAKTGTICDELVSGRRGPMSDTFKLSDAAASLGTRAAWLTLREKAAYAPRRLTADRWVFVDERTIKLQPDGAKPAPGALYELTYRAKNPKVLGMGFATRDLIDFLRHDPGAGNPAGPAVRKALAFGISQSGGYLRDFISQGFNQSVAHRRVFDGVLTHIPASVAFSSITNSASPRAPIRSMRTVSCRRTTSRSRPQR